MFAVAFHASNHHTQALLPEFKSIGKSAPGQLGFVHVTKTGGTAVKDMLIEHHAECPMVKAAVGHGAYERDWQTKGFDTVVVLRSPADRYPRRSLPHTSPASLLTDNCPLSTGSGQGSTTPKLARRSTATTRRLLRAKSSTRTTSPMPCNEGLTRTTSTRTTTFRGPARIVPC